MPNGCRQSSHIGKGVTCAFLPGAPQTYSHVGEGSKAMRHSQRSKASPGLCPRQDGFHSGVADIG